MTKWLKDHEHGTLLLLYIQPNSSETTISNEHDGRLKIKIKAPPVDGEANKELIRFLAKELSISKSKIYLIQGENSRKKNVVVVALSQDAVRHIFLDNIR